MQQQKSQKPQTSLQKHPLPKPKPQRITQLQCLSSNSQLNLYFTQSINQSFKYLPTILSKIYNQIQLLISLAQYRLTIGQGKPHPGDLLQNIQYQSNSMTKNIKIVYLLLSVIFPYIKQKIHNYVVQNPIGWKEKVLNILNKIDKIFIILHLINLSIFIKDGIYRTITQRLLKIPMQFISMESGRILDFSLMNRRLIWTIYQLFLKTILPFTHNIFASTLKNIFYLNSYLNAQSQNKNKCIICGDVAKLPMKASCSHLTCYFCYATQIITKNQPNISPTPYKCKQCGNDIHSWKKLF